MPASSNTGVTIASAPLDVAPGTPVYLKIQARGGRYDFLYSRAPDQWTMLKQGNTASGKLPGLDKLGIQPRPLGLFLDRWMTRYRKHGRFSERMRDAA